MFKNFLNKVKENEEKLKNRANVLFDKTKEKKATDTASKKYSLKGFGDNEESELSILNDKKIWDTNGKERSTKPPKLEKEEKKKEIPTKKKEKDYSKVADLMYPTMKKKEDDTKKEKDIQELETKEKGDKMEKINDQEKSDFDNINFSENARNKASKIISLLEGFRPDAYKDTGGVWTIGYGHTKNVKQGDKITKEDAEKLFKEDLEEHIIPLKKVKVPLNDNQKAALASFIYNVGPTAFAKSTLLKKLNNGDIKGASDEFDKWIYDNGTIVDGLINRRKAEKELFLSKEN